MDNNTNNTQQAAEQEPDSQQNRKSADQQQEKLFTQADVDRIVGNRLARMKQDLEITDAYRRERDEARRELEQYKNNAFLKEQGVREEDQDYVTFKVMQLVDDKTDFRQATEKFLKENPRFTGRGFRVVSTGSSGRNSGSDFGSSGADDADIRKAMGLKG